MGALQVDGDLVKRPHHEKIRGRATAIKSYTPHARRARAYIIKLTVEIQRVGSKADAEITMGEKRAVRPDATPYAKPRGKAYDHRKAPNPKGSEGWGATDGGFRASKVYV